MEPLVTHLVLKECIPDILSHSRHSQDVTFTILVSQGADTIVERDTIIPNQPECARDGLA